MSTTSSVVAVATTASAAARRCVLWIHEATAGDDLMINPEVFPNVSVGQLLSIHQSDKPPTGPPRIFLQVTSVKPTSNKQLQVSVSKYVADLFNLQSRRDCFVSVVPPESVALDFMQISFKEQYLGRSDMWRLERTLVGKSVYVEKKISHASMRAQIKRLYIGGKEVECGLVTENTKTVFRSESAKYHVFLQMSREMWEFDEDGELYLERAMQGFLPELFERWTALGTNHDVSVILFSRLYYNIAKPSWYQCEASSAPSTTSSSQLRYNPNGLMFRLSEQKQQQQQQQQTAKEREWAEDLAWDARGRCYQDFYKVISDYDTRTDLPSLMTLLKEECLAYQQHLFDQSWVSGPDGTAVQALENSSAGDGNFLEATNLALNLFERVYINRDLSRTGLSVLVVTPGTGLFEVNHDLLKLTKHRMIDLGIGCDVLCLSRPPLHTVPLFRSILSSGQDHYSLPHWIDISFYNRNPSDLERPYRPSKFVPSCKMYSLQMGIVECDPRAIKLHPAETKTDLHLVNVASNTGDKDGILWKDYDNSIFLSDGHPMQLWQSSKPAKGSAGAGGGRPPLSVATAAAIDDSPVMPSRHQRNPSLSSVSSRKSASTVNAVSATNPTPAQRRPMRNVVEEPDMDRSPSPTKTERPRPFPHQQHQHLHSSTVEVDGDDDAALSPVPSALDGAVGDRPEGIPVPGGTIGRDTDVTGGVPMSASYMHFGSGAPPANVYGTSPMPITAWGVHLAGNDTATSRTALLKYNKNEKKEEKLPINPFNPTKNVVRLSAYRRRWYHAFPVAAATISGVELHSIKWSSLCTPACLPLTTDYFPTPKELDSTYKVNTYTMSLLNRLWYKKTEMVFQELISQRLAQGFQLVVTGASAPLSSSSTPSPMPPSKLGDKRVPSVASTAPQQHVQLSIGNHFHKLTLDLSRDSVELTRYQRGNKTATPPINYHYRVWPRYHNEYISRKGKFQHVELEMYKWNKLDNLIAGHIVDYRIDESLKFWSKRFVLIPMNPMPKNIKLMSNIPATERFDDEETRITAFLRFVEALEKAQRMGEEKRALSVQVTTVAVSSYISTELQNRPNGGNQADRPEPSKPLPKFKRDSLTAVALAMNDPETGVPQKERKWHLRLYRKCFVGKEAVDWFINRIEGLETREDAMMYGQELVNKEVIVHSRKKHHFLDGFFFYQVNEVFVAQATAAAPSSAPILSPLGDKKPVASEAVRGNVQRWLRIGRSSALSRTGSSSTFTSLSAAATTTTTSMSTAAAPATSSAALAPSESSGSLASMASSSNNANSPLKFDMTRSIILDVDPSKKSDRVEWAVLHCDTIYNPLQCYHIQLQWLVATGRLIDEQIQSWVRRAAQYGFQLVEVPVAAIVTREDEPFRSPIPIPLAIKPPATSGLHEKSEADEVSAGFFEGALLKKFNFILDLEPDAKICRPEYTYSRSSVDCEQYVHTSGISLVQVLPDGAGFVWENNRLITSKMTTNSADALRAELTSFCNNSDSLAKFWAEVRATLVGINDEADDDEELPTTVPVIDRTDSLSPPAVEGAKFENLELRLPTSGLRSAAPDRVTPPSGPAQLPQSVTTSPVPVTSDALSEGVVVAPAIVPPPDSAMDAAHLERSVDEVLYHSYLHDAQAIEWMYLTK